MMIGVHFHKFAKFHLFSNDALQVLRTKYVNGQEYNYIFVQNQTANSLLVELYMWCVEVEYIHND